MTSTNHGIDLASLSRSQLQQLITDTKDELSHREDEDRAALEEKVRALIEAHGFDPKAVRFTGNGKRKNRKNATKGAAHE